MIAVRLFSSNCCRVALDLLYPPKCGLCGLLDPKPICDTCASELEPSPIVPDQAVRTRPLDFVKTLLRYEGRGAQAVRRLKYARITPLAEPLAARLAERARCDGLLHEWEFVPVPIHWTRRCQRGFNQAELLCAALPRESVLARVLQRRRATRPQAGLTRHQRMSNLQGAFVASGDIVGRSLVLVDDVFTSGQTARECAEVLLRAGAARVGVLAVCGEEI
jgi:ComF family protein